MLEKRGYEIKKTSPYSMLCTYKNKLINVYIHDNKYVFSTDSIKDYILDMNKDKIIKSLIIVKEKNEFNKILTDKIKEYNNSGYDIELFKESFFYIDITENMPKHIILTDEEKDELLKKYKIEDLPKISINDPQAKYIDAKKDDIIKIIKKTETNFNLIKYRHCIDEIFKKKKKN